MVDCPFHPKVLQTDYIFESCAIIKRVIKEYKTSKEEAKSKKRTLNLESVSLCQNSGTSSGLYATVISVEYGLEKSCTA